MLNATVAAIQPQACRPGKPNAARTARFGIPAPITRAEIAPVESARDFTHAFHVAWSAALTSMTPKTSMSKGEPSRSRQSTFDPVPIRPRTHGRWREA
jgi:hypothetical protein